MSTTATPTVSVSARAAVSPAASALPVIVIPSSPTKRTSRVLDPPGCPDTHSLSHVVRQLGLTFSCCIYLL